MLIVAILVIGLSAGWAAHLLVGRGQPNYGRLFLVGIAGSLVGGLVGSLLFGDGLELRLSGLVGSILGAILVLVVLNSLGAGTPKQQSRH
ncbi:GlsB/YeaQ/YmgE family stress response membrane protein [Knoellia sp. p5-6-4]|uniref:GlsB/YeaQ/YmgE family stress response membrane protein n=1 Tax=unclassified Knoellia TaxID=2618719 RepID=UPI0023DC52BA|nr:GlsB/YeaQ/YmgE family stress response membrane protein [Knoellia sp. p5-6-4]MDF2144635.1 GlsB/YeaQ/YmgE family stress response membrane protein [Knoellia sp. p5-6-4]